MARPSFLARDTSRWKRLPGRPEVLELGTPELFLLVGSADHFLSPQEWEVVSRYEPDQAYDLVSDSLAPLAELPESLEIGLSLSTDQVVEILVPLMTDDGWEELARRMDHPELLDDDERKQALSEYAPTFVDTTLEQ